MTFAEVGKPISRFALADLAIRSAIELERFRSGGTYDTGVLAALAEALAKTSSPAAPAGPSQFFAVGYHKPYMRLFRAEQGAGRTVKEVQGILSDKARSLTGFLEHPTAELSDQLASFCTELHDELASEQMTEVRLARRRRPRAADREVASTCPCGTCCPSPVFRSPIRKHRAKSRSPFPSTFRIKAEAIWPTWSLPAGTNHRNGIRDSSWLLGLFNAGTGKCRRNPA